MSLDIDVKGADRLERTLDGAADELARMDAAAAETSRIVAAAGAALAPKASGALAASVRAEPQGPVVQATSASPYAPFVHYGTKLMAARPFLIAAVRQTEQVWIGSYTRNADQVLSHVKGN